MGLEYRQFTDDSHDPSSCTGCSPVKTASAPAGNHVRGDVIRAIEPGDLATAKSLLIEGFPNRRPSTWDVYFERMQSLGGNASLGVPMGYLLMQGDAAVGLILTPATQRANAAGKSGLIVNLSSWYIRPNHRWRGVQMMKSILARHDAMFTDLTPTVEVQKLLPVLGFEPINSGVVVTPLPVAAALSSGGATVRAPGARDWNGLDHGLRELFLAHTGIGCLSTVLKCATGEVQLLFRPRRFKGVPAAKLVYCDDLETFNTHLPSVARYLLGQGIVLLIHDDHGLPNRAFSMARPRGLKFAKPGGGLSIRPSRIDHAGSELTLLDY